MGQDAASQLKLLLTTADQPPAALRLGNPLLKWQITDPTGTLPEWAKAGPLGQIGEEGEVVAPIPRGVWEGPQTTCSWDDTALILHSAHRVENPSRTFRKQTSVREEPSSRR